MKADSHIIDVEDGSLLRSAMIVLSLTLLSVMVAASVINIFDLRAKWAIYAFLGLLFPFILAIIKDARRFLIWMMLFTVPLNLDYLFFYRKSIAGFDGIGLAAPDIILFFLMAMWLFESAQAKRIGYMRFFPAITWPSLAFIAACGISMLAAEDLLLSSFDIFNFIKALLFFIYLANNIRDEKDTKLVLSALTIGLLIQAVIQIAQFYRGSPIGFLGLGELVQEKVFYMEGDYFTRPGGTVGVANIYARYLILILPIAFLQVLSGRGSLPWLNTIIATVGMVSLILSRSRSSWGGLLIAAICVLPYLFTRQVLTMRSIKKMAVVAILGACIFAGFSQMVWTRLTGYDNGSTHTRITTAKVAWKIIGKHPLIGVGINNYDNQLKDNWIAEDKFTKRAAVHNSYLMYMAEIGVLGTGCFLWFLIAVYFRTISALNSRSIFLRSTAMGIFWGFIAFVISLLANPYKQSYVLVLLVWILAAIIEAIIRISENQNQLAVELISKKPY